jgi:hypothetical protein
MAEINEMEINKLRKESKNSKSCLFEKIKLVNS